MCGKTPKTPKVVERDLVAEKAQADAQAAQAANAETVARRRRQGGGGAGGMVAQAKAMRSARDQVGAASLLATTKPGG